MSANESASENTNESAPDLAPMPAVARHALDGLGRADLLRLVWKFALERRALTYASEGGEEEIARIIVSQAAGDVVAAAKITQGSG